MKKLTPTQWGITVVAAVALLGAGYAVGARPKEPETPGEKLGAAMDEMTKGMERAAEKLEDK